MATRVLYDLAGADPAVRFSPYCWRVRLALAHKGLDVETRPWRFVERDALAPSGQSKVPVLVEGDVWLADSLAIARHLEEAYPNRPALFPRAGGLGEARLVVAYADTVLNPALAPLYVADIHAMIDEGDKAYFRESREARFGTSIEALAGARETKVEGARKALLPLRHTLRDQPFLAGEAPAYADYAVFGAFMWARAVSTFDVLEEGDAVYDWRERMLDLFDGLARRAPRAV